MDEKKKKLNRMAIWTITIFATVFAIVLAVLWLVSGGSLGTALTAGWPILLLVAVICIVVYFGYRFILLRKK
jgi:uncharacterized RDD family membrane protein YckC